jgi:carbon-monoxide dehydrogenase medium subunit
MSLRVQYARPRSLDQAAELLGGLTSGAVIIAGGQELMPHLNYGRLAPAVLVDISNLNELRGIQATENGVAIGALCVHRDIQHDALVGERAPLLAFAAGQVGGGWQVQNRGTIGGNIVAMHPLYDIAPPLLALQAAVEIRHQQDTRSTSLAALIADPAKQLGGAAVITQVLVPTMAAESGWAYEKLQLTAGSYGSANAATVVTLDGNHKLTAIRLVVGAVTEQPLDVSEQLGDHLIGKDAETALAGVAAICEQAVTEPLSDQQGDGEYRRAMAGVIGRRAVAAAMARIIDSPGEER